MIKAGKQMLPGFGYYLDFPSKEWDQSLYFLKITDAL